MTKRRRRKGCIYDTLKMPTQAIFMQAQNLPGAVPELQGTAHRTTYYSVGVRMLC